MEFERDVLAGLALPQKAIPGKYLWNDAGAVLFERVCAGAHYYVTRHETALLGQAAAEIAAMVGSGATLVEFGSGGSHKVRLLLDAMASPQRYVAVDIAPDCLQAATGRIAADYPGLAVVPVAGDYFKPLPMPEDLGRGPVLGFFPGNTIGSYDEPVLIGLMARLREALGPASWFLVGVDPNADAASILRGYADPEGLMAAFHRNVLHRLVAELDTDLDPENFRHEARVFETPARTEAHLVAVRAADYRVAGRTVSFAADESIHTDNSYKYVPALFERIAVAAGWRPERVWLDNDKLFSLHLLRG